MACEETPVNSVPKNSPHLLILGGNESLLDTFAKHMGCSSFSFSRDEGISQCPATERCRVHLYEIQSHQDTSVRNLLERRQASEGASSEQLVKRLHAVWWVADEVQAKLHAVWWVADDVQEFPSEVWKLLAEVPIFIVVCRKASLSRLHAIKEQCPWATAVLPVLCEQGEEDEEGESMPMYAQVKAQMQDLCRETERHLPELPKSFQLEASEAELEVVVHRNDSNDHQTDDINGINDIDLRAHRFITVFSALAAAAGATPATPAPFMDFVLLLCILRTMLLDLARTYDIQIQPSEALKLLSFQMNGLSICICLAIMLGSFLKLHPDWGAVGNLTNAIIASWFTAAIGFLFQEIFRRMSRSPLDFYVMKPQEQKNYFFQQFQM